MQLKRIITSQVTHYAFGRYLSYIILFVVSILSAKYLDVYYFGIYSFILLLLQYATYVGHIPVYSLNTILSEKKGKKDFCNVIWSNSLFISVIVTMLTVVIMILFSHFNLFEKYQFKKHLFPICLLIIITNFNGLYANLYRVYGNLRKLLFFQLIIPSAQFVVLFFARHEQLLFLILASTVVANMLALFVFYKNQPLSVVFSANSRLLSIIFKRGIGLLIYNVTFYLIILSSRTIVATLQTPEQLAHYSLANNLAGAVFMIVGAMAYIYYPKLINRFSGKSLIESISLLKRIEYTYVPICYFLVFSGFLFIPCILWLLPNYADMIPNLKLLLLAQLFFNQCFGSTVLLISHKKERLLTLHAIVSIAIVCACLMFFWLTNIHVNYWGIAVLLASFYYILLVSYSAYSTAGNKISHSTLFRSIFPWRLLVPILISLVSIAFNNIIIFSMTTFIVFLLLNYNYILKAVRLGTTYIVDEKSLHF